MSVLHDILRRRARSALTVSGVAIGVLTIVLLGAVAEKSRMQIELVDEYQDGVVTVVEEQANVSAFNYNAGTRPLSPEAMAKIREVPGVREVLPQVVLLLDPSGWTPGMQPTIVGGFGARRLEQHTGLASGRFISEDEHGVVDVGSDLVDQLDAEVGETVELQGREFEVVGILRKTDISAIDQAVMVPLEDARVLYVESLPEAYREAVDPATVTLSASVVAADGIDAEELAAVIDREVADVSALGPADVKQQSQYVLRLLDALVGSVGFIALVAGGMSVINTMTVAATERTREIGVKRALGASRGRIARDVLLESAAIGAIGGVVGGVIGTLIVALAGTAITAATGRVVFAVTPGLLVGAFAIAVVLGVLGGLYPARYASRLDPVDALGNV